MAGFAVKSLNYRFIGIGNSVSIFLSLLKIEAQKLDTATAPLENEPFVVIFIESGIDIVSCFVKAG